MHRLLRGEYYSPYFITDWPGGGVCLALGWSGFWKAYFHIKEGVMSFKGGLKRCNFYMKPGEKLQYAQSYVCILGGRA